ncbi:restriction endonuclease [Acinetobacter johnsonii]|uniref:Restriction endonuclease n=1 Tax=Acinetobacter johnsonii TaxID=40214 RepID=A0A3R9LFK9_ACIJO|nr:restriction endonuclease [Acinetobacter johnsonii]RSE18176.1 restriction endonuclease [Acinetobacter johnsonii]
MVKNTGREYEEFVQTLYKAILASEKLGLGKQNNIVVEINKILTDRNGVERQFDIYWEYNLGGINYQTVIECKDYSRKVSIEKIDALIGKLNDFPNIRGLFATTLGYQSGAEIKANQHNIDLLVIRQQTDADWNDAEGNPLIREVNIEMVAIRPAHITNFNILLPVGSDPIQFTDHLNIEISIKNDETGESFTLFDLQHKLLDGHNGGYGEFTRDFRFPGSMTTPSGTIVIEGFIVSYIHLEPAKSTLNIDFSEKLLGVVEYLNQGKKAKVFQEFIHVEDRP